MNLLILFDNVYFFIGYLYDKGFNDRYLSEFAGLLLLSLFQAFNIITLVGFTYKSLEELAVINPVLIVLFVFLPMLALNTIRYKKIVTYDQLANEWENKNRSKKIAFKIGVFFYFVLTMVLFMLSGNVSPS